MARVTLNEDDRAREIAADFYFLCYPDWSVDQLLCHPDEAKTLCNGVRAKTGNAKLEDFDILWGLLGSRKRGRLQPRNVRRRKAKGRD